MIKHAHPFTRRQLREFEEELLRERARVERSTGGDAHTEARRFAVTEALRRLAEGSYGICVGCRTPIPYGRLVVMPETAHCLGCGARA
jgi:RNA polymerase-binding transcription factor DksA